MRSDRNKSSSSSESDIINEMESFNTDNLKNDDHKENSNNTNNTNRIELTSNESEVLENSTFGYFSFSGTAYLKQAAFELTENGGSHDVIIKLYTDAIEAFTKASRLANIQNIDLGLRLQNDRDLSEAYRLRGEYRQAHSLKPDSVSLDFFAALSHDQVNDKNFFNLAKLASKQADSFFMSEDLYNRAIEANPSVAKYHNARGDLYNQHGKFEAAADDYIQALKINSDCETTKSKKQLFELFKKLPVERQKKLYRECLETFNNADSALYARMAKPESVFMSSLKTFGFIPQDVGFVKCNANKGTLKSIREELKKIDPDWKDPYEKVQAVQEEDTYVTSYMEHDSDSDNSCYRSRQYDIVS